jgi:hypothetical protein
VHALPQPLADAYGLLMHRNGQWEWTLAPGVSPSPRYQHAAVSSEIYQELISTNLLVTTFDIYACMRECLCTNPKVCYFCIFLDIFFVVKYLYTFLLDLHCSLKQVSWNGIVGFDTGSVSLMNNLSSRAFFLITELEMSCY